MGNHKKQLDKIFDYYSTSASLKVAQKIVLKILSDSKTLSSNPYLGQMEELLVDRTEPYHYLISRNYKVIYSIDELRSSVNIADVFDTRQNPIKIKRNK